MPSRADGAEISDRWQEALVMKDIDQGAVQRASR
jgi:hypothetical protein